MPPAASTLTVRYDLEGNARRRAIVAVSLAVVLSVLDYATVNVALPSIARYINANAASAIWVINAYQVTSLASLLPLAAVGDRVGHARVCLAGLLVFLVASVFCALSNTLLSLSMGRALQGFGAGCILSVNTALIRLIYPDSTLGRGIALNGLVVATGVAAGPTLAAVVLSIAPWQGLFLINVPLGCLALYFVASALPVRPVVGAMVDLKRIALLIIGVGGFGVGVDSVVHQTGGWVGLVLIMVGGICLGGLVWFEIGKTAPLLPLDLLARPRFRGAFLVGITGFVASNFFIISMPFGLMGVLGRGPVTTGALMTPWPVTIMITAPFVGRLADRYPAAVLSTIGLMITAAGFLLLRAMPHDVSDVGIGWRICVAAAGFGLFQPPNNKAMAMNSPGQRGGSASGMISMARLLGQTIGGALVALTLGTGAGGATGLCLSLASGTALLAAVLSGVRALH